MTENYTDCVRQADALMARSEFATAEVMYRQLLTERPDDFAICNKLGWVLRKQARWLEAMLAFRATIALRPDFAGAHANLALVLLQLGAYAEGWREYEFRLLDDPALCPNLPFPHWQGQPPMGKRFLLLAEQGYGDSIQFVRYVSLLAEQGAVIDILVSAPLVRLLSGVAGVRTVFSQLDTTVDAYDYQCPLMSLPHYLQTTLENVPNQVPYIDIPPDLAQHWQSAADAAVSQSKHKGKLRLGLVWAGGQRPHDAAATAIDLRRSLHLSDVAPWLAVPEICWFSLQLGEPGAQLMRSSADTSTSIVPMIDLTPEITDFLDTAALISTLDGVVSVDTAVAHLAGALNVPVWIVNRYDLCWRWLQGREDSPWYPSARLFRQPQAGDWAAVVAEVESELRQWAGRA